MDSSFEIPRGLKIILATFCSPLTRQGLENPILGCKYSMILYIFYTLYNNISQTIQPSIFHTLAKNIESPYVQKIMSGIFEPSPPDILVTNFNDIIIQYNTTQIFPLIFVKSYSQSFPGDSGPPTVYTSILHYCNIVSHGTSLFMFSSYGSNYVTIPFKIIQITINEITVLCVAFSLLGVRNPTYQTDFYSFIQQYSDVLKFLPNITKIFNGSNIITPEFYIEYFFKKYFLSGGLSTSHRDENTNKTRIYSPITGSEHVIDEYTAVGCKIEIYFLSLLEQLLRYEITTVVTVGGKSYGIKQKIFKRKRKTNKKKQTIKKNKKKQSNKIKRNHKQNKKKHKS